MPDFLRKKEDEIKKVTDRNAKKNCIQETSLNKNTAYYTKFKNLYMFSLLQFTNHCSTDLDPSLEYMSLEIRMHSDTVLTLVNVQDTFARNPGKFS